jgi:hypothetical protein
LTRELAGINQIFSDRVATILEKMTNKVMRHEVQIVDIDEGVYKVIAKNERITKQGTQDRSYRIVVNQGGHPKCKCRKLLNTYIICSHVLVVCAARNYDPNEFTDPICKVDAMMSTLGGRFEVLVEKKISYPMNVIKSYPIALS